MAIKKGKYMKLDFSKSYSSDDIKDKASEFLNTLKNKLDDTIELEEINVDSISFEVDHNDEKNHLESKEVIQTVGIKGDDAVEVATMDIQEFQEEDINAIDQKSNYANELKAKLSAIFSKKTVSPSSAEVTSAVNKIHETKNFKKLDRETISQPKTTKEELTTSISDKLKENPDNQALQELALLFDS